METRKETLSTLKVCRFCLSNDEPLIPLYDNKARAPKKSVPFALKILACIAIEIFPSDNMPQYICQRCKLFMELSYVFKQLCRQTDEAILQYIQTGSPLTPMPWPAQLSKVYRATNKSNEANIVKTVVQGGATVKVMAEEVSDSEEGDDDNVYNVKIGDGSDEGKSIKVITSVDKNEQSGSKKEFQSVSKLARHVREHAGVRSYPCKHCDKTFTKSHHHTRHLRMKHSETVRTAGPYTESEKYRCDECDDTFTTQDELMYHSALHATRNLICPLCQEKFDDVDTVTAHIKSHVNGTEFMCDFCELIFTTKEKLESHIARTHDDELLANDQETENDESSMDMDAEDAEDDDDNSINVKEVDGHMVVEIKKAGEYMLPTVAATQNEENMKSEDDSNMNFADFPMTEVETIPTTKQVPITKEVSIAQIQDATPKEGVVIVKGSEAMEVSIGPNSSSILRKAEEIKRKAAVIQQQASASDKKEKTKIENNSTATGASDKSLRLLEKELQDLKRTNTRTDAAKTPIRTVESLRNRRPQLFSSTPKIRTLDKKDAVVTKPAPEKVVAEKKQLERKITKDTKEPKEAKSNNNNVKEDKGNGKEEKGNNKEDKEVKGEKEVAKEEKKESKEKETPKTIVKNGGTESATPVEEAVRRSTRPSKVKDYAKMIRDSSLNSDDNDTDAEDDDFEDYKEPDKTPESTRARGRRGSVKQTPAATPAKTPSAVTTAAAKATPATPASAPRKRGRPRKGQTPVVPSKIKKDDRSDEEGDQELMRAETSTPRTSPPTEDAPKESENTADGNKTPDANKMPRDPRPGVIISPSGQTLKKVPIKALPPGVKPLPLPVNSRLGGGEVTEMQIGKKIVKVQKIVMTKAEVEAMTKKGLLEIKDGTMVLKPGIKLPAADPAALKSTLVGDAEQKKESPTKHEKAAPTRCDLEA